MFHIIVCHVSCSFRYLFEADHSQFFPTIAMEKGPIKIGVLWPEAVLEVPQFSLVSPKPTIIMIIQFSSCFLTWLVTS